MFETLAADPRRSLRVSPLAFAACLHAAVILGLLWLGHAAAGPGIVFFPRGPEHIGKPVVPSGDTGRRAHPAQPPRAPATPQRRARPNLAAPAKPAIAAPEPSEPAVPAAPESVGQGDPGDGPADGESEPGGEGIGCAGGQCAPASPGGGEEILAVDPVRMTRPRPSASCGSGPSMPEQARLMGITGAVVARYVVHQDGRVGEVQIVNPSAPPVLVSAVRAFLESCPFSPSLVNGRPVAVRVEQPFVFRLR